MHDSANSLILILAFIVRLALRQEKPFYIHHCLKRKKKSRIGIFELSIFKTPYVALTKLHIFNDDLKSNLNNV